MTNMLRNRRKKDWARLAMRAGLLLTDAKLWSAIQNQMHDRADDISDVINEKYQDASERFSNASDAHHGYGVVGSAAGQSLGRLWLIPRRTHAWPPAVS
jgi:hypothetical protein